MGQSSGYYLQPLNQQNYTTFPLGEMGCLHVFWHICGFLFASFFNLQRISPLFRAIVARLHLSVKAINTIKK